MQFHVIDYVRKEDSASADAIEAFDYANQNAFSVLRGVRYAADAMMAWLRAHPYSAVELVFPSGGTGLIDEAFSDNFQEQLWNGVGLSKFGHITIRGAGGTRGTEIHARWDFISGVRTRSFGPWLGELRPDGSREPAPTPRFLFPLFVQNGAPIGISVRDLRLVNSAPVGKSPVPLFKCNELDAMNQNLSIQGFRNWGLMVTGTYNSTWSQVHVEGSGLQPVEGGSILGAPAGFPPTNIVFKTAGGLGTLKVYPKALDGSAIPYFDKRHEGKRFFVHQGVTIDGTVNGAGQGVVGVIQTVNADGSADLTFDARLMGRTIDGPKVSDSTNGSFLPVTANTRITGRDARVIVLSDRITLGAGATDMKGHYVGLPKAGATGAGRLQNSCDALLTRIADVGDADATGFRELVLCEEPRLQGSGLPLVMGATFCLGRDEALDRSGQLMGNNDTDFIHLRAENSGGYGGEATTSSCIAWLVALDGAVNFVSCKFHGGDPLRGSNAQDAYTVIMDCVTQAQFTGLTVTHGGWGGKGQIWCMGKLFNAQFFGLELGGWQLDQTTPLIQLDPASDRVKGQWNLAISGVTVNNGFWPSPAQVLITGSANNALIRSNTARVVATVPTAMPNGTVRVITSTTV